MKSSNPIFRESAINNQIYRNPADMMTYTGALNKSIFLFFITTLTFMTSFGFAYLTQNPFNYPLLIGFSILGFIIALIISFVPKTAPFLSPVYAAVEGLFLGLLSFIMNAYYPGIVFEATAITFGIFFAMLFMFRTGIIKVTQKFRAGVIAATLGVFIVYLLSFVLNMFGINVPFIHESGIIGIGFSCVVLVIASLNLLLDFDMVEQCVNNGMPKYMEWYCAFGLLVTLIWIYIEALRLLAKLKDR